MPRPLLIAFGALALSMCSPIPARSQCAVCVAMDACGIRSNYGGVCIVRCTNGLCNCGESGDLCRLAVYPEDELSGSNLAVLNLYASDPHVLDEVVGTNVVSRVTSGVGGARGPITTLDEVVRTSHASSATLHHVETLSALGRRLADYEVDIGGDSAYRLSMEPYAGPRWPPQNPPPVAGSNSSTRSTAERVGS